MFGNRLAWRSRGPEPEQGVTQRARQLPRTARTFFLAAALATGCSIAMLQSGSPIAATRSIGEMASTLRKENGHVFLVVDLGAERKEIELDIPDGVKIQGPIRISCQYGRTIVVTPQYIIRTLGYGDIHGGKPMLGTLADGTHFVQNALAIPLDRLGRMTSLTVDQNWVYIGTLNGPVYAIDTDRGTHSAVRIERP